MWRGSQNYGYEEQIQWWMNGNEKLIDKLKCELTERYKYFNKQACTRIINFGPPKPGYGISESVIELQLNSLPEINCHTTQRPLNHRYGNSLSDHLVSRMKKSHQEYL